MTYNKTIYTKVSVVVIFILFLYFRLVFSFCFFSAIFSHSIYVRNISWFFLLTFCCCCLTLKSKMFCIPFQNAGTEEISYNITWWISRLCRNCCRQGINVYTWNVFHFRCCVVVVVYRLLTILLFSHLVYFDVVFVVVFYLHLVWCLFFYCTLILLNMCNRFRFESQSQNSLTAMLVICIRFIVC